MSFRRVSACFIGIAAILCGFGLVSSALAAGTGGSSDMGGIALLLGSAYRSDDGFALGFELKAGYRISPTFIANLFYWKSTSGSDLKNGGNEISSTMELSAFGLEALYRFGSSYWSGGARLGLMNESRDGYTVPSTVAIDDTSSSIFVAPVVTYEVPLGSYSVGAEIAYLYPLSSSVSSALSTMAMLRYRF